MRAKTLAKELRPAREGWEEFANCRGEDVTEFVYTSDIPSKKTRAKLTKICENCPVLVTCRLEALRNNDVGWWGGMDEKERIIWAARNLK
jgi:hypothetical protein